MPVLCLPHHVIVSKSSHFFHFSHWYVISSLCSSFYITPWSNPISSFLGIFRLNLSLIFPHNTQIQGIHYCMKLLHNNADKDPAVLSRSAWDTSHTISNPSLPDFSVEQWKFPLTLISNIHIIRQGDLKAEDELKYFKDRELGLPSSFSLLLFPTIRMGTKICFTSTRLVSLVASSPQNII